MKASAKMIAAGGVTLGLGAAATVAALRRTSRAIPLETVPYVDPQRYQGRWFEIARLPLRYERNDAKNISTEYTLLDQNRIRVVNQMTTPDGKLHAVTGTASIVDSTTNAKLEVKFNPFMGASPYWIIELDESYNFAVVGEPTRRYLWVLSRSPKMRDDTFVAISYRLRAKGYDPELLIRTPQG